MIDTWYLSQKWMGTCHLQHLKLHSRVSRVRGVVNLNIVHVEVEAAHTALWV